MKSIVNCRSIIRGRVFPWDDQKMHGLNYVSDQGTQAVPSFGATGHNTCRIKLTVYFQ